VREEEAACKNCTLWKGATTQLLDGQGPPNAKFMFVGEAPGSEEDEAGVPFIGKSGKLLNKLMRHAGLRREDVFVTNAVRCKPPFVARKQKKPTAKEINACRPHLERELKSVKPEMVIALGDAPLKALTGKSGITKIRGVVQTVHKSLAIPDPPPIMPTFHPAYALREPMHETEIINDIQTAVRTLDGGFTEVPTPWVRYDDYKGGQLDFNSPVWGWDIETNAAPLNDPTLLVRMLCIDDGRNIVAFVGEDEVKAAVSIMAAYLNDERWLVGHNASGFDRAIIKKLYGVNLRTHDTQLIAHLVDEEQPLKLQDLCVSRLGVAPWKEEHDVHFWIRGPQNEQEWLDAITYCARDTRYDRMLFVQLWSEADAGEKRLYRYHNLPASRALKTMASNGVYLSVENARNAVEELSLAKRKALLYICDAADSDINPNSYPQVRELLYSDMMLPVQGITEGGLASTSALDLKKLRAMSIGGDVIQALLDHAKAKTLLAQANKLLTLATEGYTEKKSKVFRPTLYPPWIFPDYSMTSTDTGRTSSFDPFNLQQTARDKRVRSIVAAPPGYVLLEADASQFELRMAAELAGPECPLFQEYLKPDPDVHMAMAMRLTGKPRELVTKDERSRAKPPNFAMLYDPSPDAWKTYQRIALKDYDMVVEDRNARLAHDAFKEWGLKPWWMRIWEELRATGQVVSITGRHRRLPNFRSDDEYARLEAWRQGINFSDQSPASDIELLFLTHLVNEGLHCVGYIHDAIHAYLPENDKGLIDYWTAKIKYDFAVVVPEMVYQMFGYRLRIPLVADVTVGRHWGDK
jgi:uracil-DNA glycosylase family 4